MVRLVLGLGEYAPLITSCMYVYSYGSINHLARLQARYGSQVSLCTNGLDLVLKPRDGSVGAVNQPGKAKPKLRITA